MISFNEPTQKIPFLRAIKKVYPLIIRARKEKDQPFKIFQKSQNICWTLFITLFRGSWWIPRSPTNFQYFISNLGSACQLMVYRISTSWALIAKVDTVYCTCTTLWRPKRKWRKLRYFAFAFKIYPKCKICDACCCFRNPLTVWKSIQQRQIMWMRARNQVWSNLPLPLRIPNLLPLKWRVLIIILILTPISVSKACLWRVFRDERTSTNCILFLTYLRWRMVDVMMDRFVSCQESMRYVTILFTRCRVCGSLLLRR